MQSSQQHTLTSLQLELLKVYSFEPTESELIEIKTMLGKFFAQRMTLLVDQAIEKQNITEQDIENWLNED